MGFRICYLASKASPEKLTAALNVTMDAPVTDMPDGDWWIAKLKDNDWTILWSEDEEFGQHSIDHVAALSNEYDTYLCEVNETVMWSSAAFWKSGQQVWKVTHAGDGKDIYDLTETGTLPDGLADLKQKAIAQQQKDGGGVDHIFEIPLDLAALDFEYRHEHFLNDRRVDTFHTIVPPQKIKKKGLLSRLFGG